MKKNIRGKSKATNKKGLVSTFLGFISSKKILWLIFGWFIFQAIYMAISTKTGIAPDENYHIALTKLFGNSSNHGLFLSNQEGYYYLGEVTRTPFILYHYLLSFPYIIVKDTSFAVFVLRLFSIFIATGSMFVTYKIAKAAKMSQLSTNVALFMLANTLMFVFISSAVTYDNLFILLSLLLVHSTILLWNKLTIKNLLYFITVSSLGLLTKINFVPMILIGGLLIAFRLAIKWRNLMGVIRKLNLKKVGISFYLLLFFTVASFSLFSIKYIGNIIEYGDYTPNCTAVHTYEQCLSNGPFRRDLELESNKLDITKSTVSYVFDWSERIFNTTYGIMGHKSTSVTPVIKIGASIILLLALFSVSRMMVREDKNFIILLIFILAYTLILIARNHAIYERTGVFDLALQGRYIFSILPIVYLLGSHYIFELFKKPLGQSVIIAIVLISFMTASLPSYLVTTDSSWHTNTTKNVNDYFRNQVLDILE